MRSFTIAIVLFFSLSALIASGIWKGEGGTISFKSDAPLELIQAESRKLRGAIDPLKNTFAFSVSTKSFEGFNSGLQQEHFHENYIESEKYPTATFSGKFIEDISELEAGTHEVRAKGMLKIHGESVERILKCKMEVDGEEVDISSEFIVPLIDHRITIPQVVHQKIAEEILVKVFITMKKS